MSQSINKHSEKQLTALGFSQADIARINSNAYLVRQINDFSNGGGQFLKTPIDKNNSNKTAAYAQNGNIYFTSNSSVISYKVLAHELGHALGTSQSTNYPKDYSSAKAYAQSRGMGEAEAIYNEYKALQEEIKQNGYALNYDITHGLYNTIDNMTKYGKSLKDIYTFLANKNMHEMNPSTNPKFTYYQNDIWNYLSTLTTIKSDFKEIFKYEINVINNLSSIITMIDYDLFGENGNDFIIAAESNNRLNTKTFSGNAFMYGGQGNDVLMGGDGKDILLGGDDNDELHGKEGDDILGGNAGDDKLYGGEGQDYLYGGKGSDELIGGTQEDKLYGGKGNDLLEGGDGDDILYGEDNDDILDGNKDNDTLMPIITSKIKPDSVVHTDSYNALDVSDFKHFRVNHSTEFIDKQNHLNHINNTPNFWSQAKRVLKKYLCLDKKNFHLFIKECEFRFNYGTPSNQLRVLRRWCGI